MTPFAYHRRSLAARWPTSLAAALGVALVVFVVAAVLMLLAGLRHTLAVGGDPRRVLVLREGSDSELTSQFEAAHAGRVLAAPQIVRGEAEAVVTMGFTRTSGGLANAVLRGIGAQSAALRPEVQLIDGRWPQGNEVAVGRALLGRYVGLSLGATLDLADGARVVGVFAGGASESELWAELAFVQRVAGRRELISSILVALRGAEDFAAFSAWVGEDVEAGLVASREADLRDRQGDQLASLLLGIGAMLAACFALAAGIGVAVTLHAHVARRRRELGTLRALGFTRTDVLVGVLVESGLLGLAGALLGLGGAALLARRNFSLVNPASFAQLVFPLELTLGVVVLSFAVAVGAGLLGGLLPAIRAAAVPPAGALKR